MTGGARKGAGRKRIKFTAEDIKQIETYAGLGISESNIAMLLNVHYDALRNNKKRNAEFSQALKRGRSKCNIKVSSALYSAAIGGNITAQIFFLKARAGWSETETGNNEEKKIDPIIYKIIMEQPKDATDKS